MAEKRFKHHMGLICEKKDGEYYSFTVKEVCDLLNDFSDENKQLKQENTTLKTWSKSLQINGLELAKYLQAYDEILNTFIRGIESEKNIDPDNKDFQEKMNFTLNYLKQLKEEFKNVDEFIKLKKEVEQ